MSLNYSTAETSKSKMNSFDETGCVSIIQQPKQVK